MRFDQLECYEQLIDRALGLALSGEKSPKIASILAEEGFVYDSSLCPIGREFKSERYRSSVHAIRCPAGKLWEVPVSTWRILGWSLPISGGNYFRQFPDWPVRRAVSRWAQPRQPGQEENSTSAGMPGLSFPSGSSTRSTIA